MVAARPTDSNNDERRPENVCGDTGSAYLVTLNFS